MKHPTSHLVALAWLRDVHGVNPALVDAELPQDNSTWAASGFVQVPTVVGGSPGVYVPRRGPVVQVDCWAVTPDSSHPARNRANELAERIVADTYPSGARLVTAHLPAGYNGARVTAATALTEPRPVPGDESAYGHVTFDLELDWVEVA